MQKIDPQTIPFAALDRTFKTLVHSYHDSSNDSFFHDSYPARKDTKYVKWYLKQLKT